MRTLLQKPRVMPSKQWLFLAASMFILCACSSSLRLSGAPTEEIAPTVEFLSQNPQPLPKFVSRIEPPPGSIVKSGVIFIAINQGGIWETGNDAGVLHNHLMSHTSIKLDGSRAHCEIDTTVYDYGIDDDGKVTTNYYNPLQIECLLSTMHSITPGAHLGTIQTTSLSGVRYEYSWVFVVGD